MRRCCLRPRSRAVFSHTSSAPSAARANTESPRSFWAQRARRFSRVLLRCASSPFDDEGVKTSDRDLVRAGVLQGYVLGSYSARKLGLTTTGNAGGVHNLFVSSSLMAPTFEELLARMGTGLLVTELMGQGVNGVTGDYSRGASGFWVQGGSIAFPVHEVTIAGNLRAMYRQILAVGADVDKRGGLHTGSVLIEDMTIAGD